MEKKRSLKYLLVSVCLALLVASIGGILAGANTAVAVDDTLEIKGATLDLNDDIGIAFAVEQSIATDSVVLEIYNTNPGDQVAEAKEIIYKSDKTVTKGEGDSAVTYALYVTDGYPADELHTTLYARLHDTDDDTYSAVLRTGVLELIYLMQEDIAADANLDPDGKRTNLYNSILAYEKAVRKNVNGDTANYHLVKVEDGYIVEDDGYTYTQGVYAEGTLLTMAPNSHAANLVGWSSNGGESLTHTLVGSTGKVKVACNASLSPLFTAYDITYSYDVSVLDICATNGAFDSDTVTGKLYSFEEIQSAAAGTTYKNNSWIGNADGAGYHSYDYATNTFHINGMGKSSTTSGYAQLTLSNPTYTNSVATLRSGVIEFDLTVPSVDNDGDGIYNEVNGDIYYTNDKNALFDIGIGYESGQNYSINYGSENVLHLTIFGSTSSKGGTVTGWSLGSTCANGTEAGFTSTDSFSGNNNSMPRYAMDSTHNVKVVISPGTYADSVLTMGSSASLARVDIYVDDELHHSRVISNSKATATTQFADRDLSISMGNSGTTPGYTRFTSNKYIGMNVGAVQNTIATLDIANIHTYAGVASVWSGDCVEFANTAWDSSVEETVSITPYDHSTKGDAYYLDRPFDELPKYAEPTSVDTNVLISAFKTLGSTSETRIGWNTIVADTETYAKESTYYGRATAQKNSLTSYNMYWYYNEAIEAITVRNLGSCNGGRTAFQFNNPWKGKSYVEGEVLVYEFDVMLPEAGDTNGNGKANETADFLHEDSTTATSLSGKFSFGFKINSAYSDGADSYRLGFEIQRNNGSMTGINSKYIIRNSGCTETGVSSTSNWGEWMYGKSEWNALGEWTHISIVVKPTEDGNVEYIDIYTDGLWNRRVHGELGLDGLYVPTTHKSFYTGGLTYVGLQYDATYNAKSGTMINCQAADVNVKGFKCYLTNIISD